MNIKSFLKNKTFLIAAAFVLFAWANNTSLFINAGVGHPRILAHRGLAQTFDPDRVRWNTNTARIIHEPEHPYLENTIPSMKAAFDCGADIVEFDVRVTKDKKLAVFHDYTLEFRTDGRGNVSDHTMEELRHLDVGYGYTADGGNTYPFRGGGAGLMPSIDEVFAAFPDKQLLIHVKDGGEEAGRLLYEHLGAMSPGRLDTISVYGDDGPVLFIRGKYPRMKILTKKILIRALLIYELVGWTGYVPAAIGNMEIHIPLKYARFLWGWPHRFLQRMERANSRVVLVTGGGRRSGGFDDDKDLDRLPENYSGYVWTNRADRIIHRCKIYGK